MTADAEDLRRAQAQRLNACLEAVGRGRDRAAFAELFAHFAPRLKAFFMKAGAEAEAAEEVVQETMINVWRKAGQFDPSRASASTWIFTIARNMRIDLLRKARRPQPDPDDPAMVPDEPAQADEWLSAEEEAVELRAAVAELPEEQKHILHLAFFEEKSHGTIADELGLPLGTVKSRIRLAFKRIRSRLEPDAMRVGQGVGE